MAFSIGVVDCLQVGDEFAFAAVEESGGGRETFIVWFGLANTTAYRRVLQNTWLGFLKESLTNGNIVRILHAEDSAFIDSVQLNNAN